MGTLNGLLGCHFLVSRFEQHFKGLI